MLSGAASKSLTRLTATAEGSASPPEAEPSPDTASQLRALLGDAGSARFKEFSAEMPARATVTQLNGQLEGAPLSAEQTANLIQVIKAEPFDLTQGILGGPDKAFMGSPADVDNFLQQVAQSNQRILQQAGGFLAPNQLSALDTVLTKAIDARKLQGAAFFQKR